jgi:DNA-binding transcriptional ArsR family regulator
MPKPVQLVIGLKARLFSALADVSRLTILDTLREGELSVGAIVEKTGLSQSNVSNHLRYLAANGLVSSTPQGRYTLYRLSSEQVAEMLELADRMLHEAAHHVYEYTNHSPDREKTEHKDQ